MKTEQIEKLKNLKDFLNKTFRGSNMNGLDIDSAGHCLGEAIRELETSPVEQANKVVKLIREASEIAKGLEP